MAYALTERTNTDGYRHRRATSRDVPDDGLLKADVITCDILYSHVRTSEESIARDTRQGKDYNLFAHCIRALQAEERLRTACYSVARMMLEPDAWLRDPAAGSGIDLGLIRLFQHEKLDRGADARRHGSAHAATPSLRAGAYR